GAGGQSVERQNGEAPEDAADKRNQQSFKEKGEDDAPRVEPDRTHGGNFAAAFGDGGVHGVEGAKDRADSHDRRDKSAQYGNELGHARGLLGVIVDFAVYIDIQTRIGGESVLQFLKSSGRSEMHGNGLGKSVRTIVGAVQEMGVAPHFGI